MTSVAVAAAQTGLPLSHLPVPQGNSESVPFSNCKSDHITPCAEPSSGFPSDSEYAHMTQSKVKVNFYSGTQGPYPLPGHTGSSSSTVSSSHCILSPYVFMAHSLIP